MGVNGQLNCAQDLCLLGYHTVAVTVLCNEVHDGVHGDLHERARRQLMHASTASEMKIYSMKCVAALTLIKPDS
jgi:hypothetical protein